MRVANWPIVLAEVIEEWRYLPLSYGTVDCFQFCGTMYQRLTGVDHLSQFPPYDSREGAEEILAQHGGPQGLIESVLGTSKHPAYAQRGDIVLADFGDGLAPGICVGAHCCTPGPAGLVFVPMKRAVAAWSV